MTLDLCPPEALPETVRLEVWSDPLVETFGHAIDSEYVETFWLPTLGPTALWMARRLASSVVAGPTVISTPALGRVLGVSDGLSKNGTLAKTWARLRTFEIVRTFRGGESAQIRTHLPTLNRRQLLHLPEPLASMHATLTAEGAA